MNKLNPSIVMHLRLLFQVVMVFAVITFLFLFFYLPDFSLRKASVVKEQVGISTTPAPAQELKEQALPLPIPLEDDPTIIFTKECSKGVVIWSDGSEHNAVLSIDHRLNYDMNHPFPSYCVCPQGYDPAQCKPTRVLAHTPKVKYAKRRMFRWSRYPFSYMDKIKYTKQYNDIVNRYLQSRTVPSVAHPMALPPKPRADQVQQLKPSAENFESLFNSRVDKFFLDLTLNNRMWDHDDRVTISLLLKWNQKVFGKKIDADSPERVKRYFSGSDIVLGRSLYTFMFSKCPCVEMMKNIISATYSPHHYYVVFMAHNMEECWDEIEQFVNQIRTNFKATNIVVVPKHYSFTTKWASMSLVHMNFVAVAYAYLNGMVDWSHEINLSEANFPLSTPEQLSNFLRINHSIYTNFVDDEYHNIGRHTFVNLGNIVLNLKNELDEDIYAVSGGSQWKVATNLLWRHIMGSVVGVKGLLAAKYSNIPDEWFMQTMTGTFMRFSKQSSEIDLVDLSTAVPPPLFIHIPNSLVWVSWKNVRGGSPNTVKNQYFNEVINLRKNGQIFFCRKVVDPDIARKLAKTVGFSYQVPPSPTAVTEL